MTIRLTHEQEQFIKQKLATGRFANESEVLQEALSQWQKQEDDLAEMRSIFSQAHQRNAHLDIEATEALIAEEVRAQRQNRRP
jgi:putative addiction module CopG family antidote